MILAALDLDASSDAQARERIAALEAEAAAPPPLLTGEAGGTLLVPVRPGRWRLQAEDGGIGSGEAAPAEGGQACLGLPAEPGYYRLEIDGHEIAVAVAPARCHTVADAMGAAGRSARCWGLAQQLYALRRPGDGGVGDFAALAAFVQEAAAHGAAAVTISPVHAQFSADPDRFSPYAPSSRIMLNALHIAADDPGPEAAALEGLELVDWPAVGRERLARLRRQFDAARRRQRPGLRRLAGGGGRQAGVARAVRGAARASVAGRRRRLALEGLASRVRGSAGGGRPRLRRATTRPRSRSTPGCSIAPMPGWRRRRMLRDRPACRSG